MATTPRFTASRIPRWFGADAIAINTSTVLIVGERENDEPLRAHERVHCSQQAEDGNAFRWWLRYLTDREFRLEMELEAYRVQLALQPGSIERFALSLATNYRLGITTDAARALLLEAPT